MGTQPSQGHGSSRFCSACTSGKLLRGDFHSHGCTPIAGWFISWNILLKWMTWRYPHFRKHVYNIYNIYIIYIYTHNICEWLFTLVVLSPNPPLPKHNALFSPNSQSRPQSVAAEIQMQMPQDATSYPSSLSYAAMAKQMNPPAASPCYGP